MKDKLKEKHDYQWEAFDALSGDALNELIDEEIAIRRQHGMEGEHVSEETEIRLHGYRKAWLQEWGARGRQINGLTNMQQREREEDEMDDMYEYHLDKQRDVMLSEIEVIRNYYKGKGQEVPQATQQRIGKRIVTLGEKFFGTPSRVPLEKWRTLNEDELNNRTQSQIDLTEQHEIIRRHYGSPENIPSDSRAWMEQELDDYKNEMDAFGPVHTSDEVEKPEKRSTEENMPDEIHTNQFKENLKNLRERQQQKTSRPKPG